MSEFLRYAIYYLPEGALGTWGESWLGWAMAAGHPLPRPPIAGLPRPVEEITAAATVYGLHATIKPPFRLAEGQTEDALRAALATFCREQTPVKTDGLALTNLDGFLALTPEGDTTALHAMAARAVEAFDAFRAPAPPDEVARRRAAGLTDRQEALLQRWGYPYVMTEFRFHITLTGRLALAEADSVMRVLDPHLAPVLPRPFVINGLDVVGQTTTGFRTIAHHTFTG